MDGPFLDLNESVFFELTKYQIALVIPFLQALTLSRRSCAFYCGKAILLV